MTMQTKLNLWQIIEKVVPEEKEDCEECVYNTPANKELYCKEIWNDCLYNQALFDLQERLSKVEISKEKIEELLWQHTNHKTGVTDLGVYAHAILDYLKSTGKE